MKGLTTNQLAKACGVNIETIRYYEKRGLISEPPRNSSGYRKFPEEVIKDIQFIKRAKDLGFTLDEIKNLLNISNIEEGNFHSEGIYNFTVSKIKEIESKINNLQQMKVLLEDLAEKCPRSEIPTSKCPIIQGLKEER